MSNRWRVCRTSHNSISLVQTEQWPWHFYFAKHSSTCSSKVPWHILSFSFWRGRWQLHLSPRLYWILTRISFKHILQIVTELWSILYFINIINFIYVLQTYIKCLKRISQTIKKWISKVVTPCIFIYFFSTET